MVAVQSPATPPPIAYQSRDPVLFTIEHWTCILSAPGRIASVPGGQHFAGERSIAVAGEALDGRLSVCNCEQAGYMK